MLPALLCLCACGGAGDRDASTQNVGGASGGIASPSGASASGGMGTPPSGGGGNEIERPAAGGAAPASGGGSATPPTSTPAAIARFVARGSGPLTIEVDSVEGLEPYEASAPYLVELMESVLDKPGAVSLQPDETLPPHGADHVWTFETLRDFATLHAQPEVEGAGARIHVLAIDGRYDLQGGGTVLGLAWSNRYVALFQDAIRARCSGSVGSLQGDVCELAERSVWAHELGHSIGLVDNGLAMVRDHKDPEHGHHEKREGCLMFWAYESPQLFDTLLSRLGSGSPELDFCEDSLADVRAAR